MPVRYKKIRGQKRLLKDVDEWIERNKKLNLDSQRDYAKIWIHPWSGISVLNSEIPEPRGEIRKRMLKGLFEIHDAWRAQLDTLGEPYYLKLWIYHKRFSKSQVVCATGDFLHFYDQTFPDSIDDKTPTKGFFNAVNNAIDDFNWDVAVDYEAYSDSDFDPDPDPDMYYSLEDYHEIMKFYRKLKKNALRSVYEFEGTEYVSYLQRKGFVYLGERKK